VEPNSYKQSPDNQPLAPTYRSVSHAASHAGLEGHGIATFTVHRAVGEECDELCDAAGKSGAEILDYAYKRQGRVGQT
jgi:hypothetical protein